MILQSNERKISKPLLILILGALSTVNPFSIDMYLPAFANIAQDLHTSIAEISLSVSSYFIGISIGQIAYGPLLDRFGRRPPLILGLSIYIASSLLCMTASSAHYLIAFRILQAIGGCSAQVASTAMVRDFFPAREASKIFSLLMLILGVSPLLAPIVGSFIVVTFGWHWVFGLLAAIVSFILAVTIIFLPEGHAADHEISLRLKPILRGFSAILRNRQFLTYALAGSFAFAGLFVYVTGSPMIFIQSFHVTPQVYGAIFASLAVGFIGGSQINILLSKKYTSAQIFKFFLSLQALLGIVFLACTIAGICGFWGSLIFLFFFLMAVGISSPNGAAIALEPFTKNAGSASSLLGFLQMGVGALMSMIVGILDLPGVLPTVAALACTPLIGMMVLFSYRPRGTR